MNITGGIYKGRKVIAPDEKITRPTLSKTRMGIFNSLYSVIGDFSEKSFLDVFGGSGIMGLEALSRGFKTVKVYEINKHSAEIIKKNYASLNIVPDLTIGNSIKLLENNEQEYDVAYVDPPYKSGIYNDVLKVIKSKITVVESADKLDYKEYKILKTKKYGSNIITFLETET